MIIEIPDDLLEPMRNMPAISQSGKCKWTKDGEVLAWMGQSGELYVPVIMFRRAVMRRAKELGLIKYDSETKTWKGVSGDGD